MLTDVSTILKNAAKLHISFHITKTFPKKSSKFGLADGTSARKCSNNLAFYSLIRTFAPKMMNDGDKESRIYSECSDGFDVSC